MFAFYHQSGSARRRRHEVAGDACTVGSARSCDLVLDTRAIAKRHAEFRLEADGVHLKDLGSAGGCWVNRERVVEHGPLSELDEIVVGDVAIVIDGSPRRERLELRVDGADERRPRAEPARSARSPLLRALGFGAGSDAAHASADGAAPTAPSALAPETRPGADASPGARGEAAADAPAAVAPTRAPVTLAAVGPVEAPAPGPGRSAGPPGPPGPPGPDESDGPDGPDGSSAAPARGLSAVAGAGSGRVVERTDEELRADERLAYWGGVVHEQLLYQMDLRRKDVNRMSDEQLRAESLALIEAIVASLEDEIPAELDRDALRSNVLDESVGLGPLERFLADDSITEIMVNNHREIFVERAGRLERSPHRFSSDRTVYSVIERIITPLGRRIDEASPIVDARLKDGSRVNAVIPPLALKGPSLTIRKFPKKRLSFADLVEVGSVDERMVEFLRVCVEMRKNVIVSGGTGSGKTTLLNVLSNFIPDSDRIVTIEDAAELKLVQPNLVSLESRPANVEGKGSVPIRELVRNSLRMRPDRIIVVECRGGEALDMLQAMNTGHDGSLTTVHANNPRDTISRLEVLVLMAGMDLPVTAIREQVASAVDLIIQQTRFPCGTRKITKITEVVGVESGTVQLQDIFVYRQEGLDDERRVRGRFEATGAVPTFYEELRSFGMEVDLSAFDVAVGF